MCTNIDDFQYQVSADHMAIARYIGEEPDPVIPAVIDGIPVKELGDYSFAGTEIECISIPEGIEHIGKNAFGMCELLKTIQTGDGSIKYSVVDGILYDMQQNALVLCPPGLNYERVQVMSGTTVIANAAFFQNTNLKQVELPLSLVRIEANAFLFTDNLPFVSIPLSVKSIDESAFLPGSPQMRGKQFRLYCFKDSFCTVAEQEFRLSHHRVPAVESA